jgi:hypothetical protein
MRKELSLDKRIVSLVILAIVTCGVMAYFFLPKGALDGRFYYNQTQAQQFLSNLDRESQHLYLLNEILDLFLISSYSLAFLLILKQLYTNREVIFFALLPGLLDFVETGTILYLLISSEFQQTPSWLGVVTTLKWSTGIGVVFFITTGLRKNQTT